MKKSLILVVLVLSFLIFGGYYVIKGNSSSKSNDFDFAIKKGEQFTIKLDENITTGYSWHYKIENEDLISLVENKYLESSSGLIGASGVHKYVFTGKEKGETKIIFKYYRSWEGEDSSVETKEFKIKIY